MKFVRYQAGCAGAQLGILNETEEQVYPLKSFGVDGDTMEDIIGVIGDEEMQRLQKGTVLPADEVKGAVPVKEVRFLAPIVSPGQDVICLGINYMAHAEESARYKREEFNGERPYAVYFSKRVNQTVNPGEAIQSHRDMVDSLDYEAELAVIVGKDAKNVPEEEAKDYLFGYTIINDVSARNIQNRHKQWYFGKSLDGFLPMGPCIVTADSLPYPPKLSIQSLVNGELRQDSNTELLIFGISHVIHELSQGMTLKAGTVISMGTPAGVGMGFNPPKFLVPGDWVECRVEGIGSLVNTVE